MTLARHWSGNAMAALFAIDECFGVIGFWSHVATVKIDDLFDDVEIERRCESLQGALGIALELPLMLKTFGDLAAYCTRQLEKKEART